ncbi:hypothetical protein DMA12_33800 [Amycolatopsis balhimycina DSM 5908]|uniref:Serine/threonine protein kinase n=2 Tax=Amycolatopsis balhimycina TaxID=208443 RepID=A0A428W5D5_AMYBA|nr:hypothetical protein DMA12_33800 [Amycolatopsis balhimycina DSM 5908]
MLLALSCAGVVVAILLVAAAVRPAEPDRAPLVTGPPPLTSVATTATSAPPKTARAAGPETTKERRPRAKASGVPRGVTTTGRG